MLRNYLKLQQKATLVTRWCYMATEAKQICKRMKIGTHDGSFHCDEVLACFMLKQLPQYKDATIIRTRDAAVLDECDVVVDVGGVYDAAKCRFDHHQRSFSETMKSLQPDMKNTMKLSSAGLVYVHYGKKVIEQISGKSGSEIDVNVIYKKVYEQFVEEIDAIDNGVNIAEGTLRYYINTNLSQRVGHLNPNWNETVTAEEIDARFHKAMAMVGEELTERVEYFCNVWLPARTLVREAIQTRHEIDSSGEIIFLPQGGAPWKSHLMSLEKELDAKPLIKFVLYPDTSGRWRVQCVPKTLTTFENRLSLLAAWRGVRDEDLSELTGIPGCVFVHNGGFIGGSKTYEGALEMARRTLKGC